MKRFKKLISVVLAVATVVSLTACGSGSSSSGGSSKAANTEGKTSLYKRAGFCSTGSR